MFSTFGDLASAFNSRSMSARLKADMTRLGQEVASGVRSDLNTAVSGDFGPLAGIEHSLKTLESFRIANVEAAAFASAAQSSLDAIQAQSQDLTTSIISATSSKNNVMMRTVAEDARQTFLSTVSQLNTTVMGRSLFAGAATDQPALASGEAILAAIQTDIAAETNAAGISARIDAWFDDPAGGFATMGYLGADQPMGPVRLGNGETGNMHLRADSQEIKDTLKAMAKSAVMANGTLSASLDQQTALFEASMNDFLAANDNLVGSRAEIGTLEERIEDATTRNEAEKAALKMSRNELIAVDPYQTATELKAIYGQLESLYTVTAHLSKLSFTDYMR